MHVNEESGYYADKTRALADGLIGRTVEAIYLNEELLTLDIGNGDLASWRVEGDCCSYSYFHDITGVRNLLDNGPITGFDSVELSPGDVGYHPDDCEGGAGPDDDSSWREKSPCGEGHDSLQVYGYRFTTEHPIFGPVSTVIAFRNDSNGYYGGWMEREREPRIDLKQRRITEDVVGPLEDAAEPIVGETAMRGITD